MNNSVRQRIKTWISKAWRMRSLKVRVFLIFLLVGIIPALILRAGIVANYEKRAISQRQTVVENQMKILANHLITYNYLSDTSSPVINAELEMLTNLYDGRVLIINGDYKVVKDTYGISEGKIIISEEVFESFNGKSMSNYVESDEDVPEGYVEMVIPITETMTVPANESESGKEEEVTNVKGVMLISFSAESITTIKDLLIRKSTILEVLLIIAISGLAAFLAILLAKPFDRVTDAIVDVKEGRRDEAIPVSDYVETTHIIDAFNQLLERERLLNESRQEFVANVSHELKTPLTSMKVLADSLLENPDVPTELYREFLTDIAAEIDRENSIITDLLALVKMDKTANELNISKVNINDLLEIILKRLRPIARKMDVEVLLECKRVVEAEIDEVKMSLIISNLVENAIKYNKEHGHVQVSLDADHRDFTLEVRDTGIGIPEESIGHVYERFYRVDKSHSREIGGTGLGLAITKNAISLHKGTIKITSEENVGTTVIVKIPLTYIKD